MSSTDQQQQSSSSNTFQPPAGFDKMTQQEQKQTYMEWAKQKYNEQYESWMPWIEDYFLKWFTKDNKASYATKGTATLFSFLLLSHLVNREWAIVEKYNNANMLSPHHRTARKDQGHWC